MNEVKEITLKEIVEGIDELSNEGTVYLYEKWTATSKGFLIIESADKDLPMEYKQAKYFLEVDLIKDVIKVFKDWHERNKDNTKKLCEAVIYYAINDTYKE